MSHHIKRNEIGGHGNKALISLTNHSDEQFN